MNKIKNITTYVTNRIDGVLSDLDKTAAQHNALLRFIFMLRSFFISNWEDRIVKKNNGII